MKFIFLSALFLMNSCEPHSQYYYTHKQSSIIQFLRVRGYYEYSSRLSDSLFIELNSIDSYIINRKTYLTIVSLEERLHEMDKKMGCFVIDWQTPEDENYYKNVITLEKNSKNEIIIRMFTRNDYLKKHLPHSSY